MKSEQLLAVCQAPIPLATPSNILEERSIPKSYRRDIDGLRAIAILSVVIFHAFPEKFRGGFAGVDVFFVISGFLISSIIFRSFQQDNFSFFEFYSHRINRIFPSLLVVLSVSFVFGWFALLPGEYKQLGKHITAGAGFFQNFTLWKEDGYFNVASELKPLMHLWSLAIEEQFYIIFPALAWLAWKVRVNTLALVLITGLFSFVMNVKGVVDLPAKTFFMPLTRFWEIMSGALLACLHLEEPLRMAGRSPQSLPYQWLRKFFWSYGNSKSVQCDISAWLGILLLVISFVILDKEMNFPGWWAALPVTGTFLVIAAGPYAWVNRNILALKPMVLIGLISYPLYLWHWPILSFMRIAESQVPPTEVRVAAVAVSVLLAWLTYQVVEKPIRFGRKTWAKPVILSALMGCLALVGYGTEKLNGVAFRQSPIEVVNHGDVGQTEFFSYLKQSFYPCTSKRLWKEAIIDLGTVRCLQSKPDEKIDIALVGDSHAEHLFPGIASALKEKNVAYYIKAGPPVIGRPDFEHIFEELRTNTNIKHVVLAAVWHRRINEVPFGTKFEDQIAATARLLLDSGKVVWVADDVPNFPHSPEKCQGRRKFSIKGITCEVERSLISEQAAPYKAAFQNLFDSMGNVRKLEIERYLCSDRSCIQEKDGTLFYRDTTHLNINGSAYIGRMIVHDNPVLGQ